MEAAAEIAREKFVAQWGALGTAWGINRTMAQIHALLLTSEEPLCTDQVMEALQISRGNANTNLRELVSWGIVDSVVVRGDRKDYYAAEKDVWKIFCTIARERKRREIEPALRLLGEVAAETAVCRTTGGKQLHAQMKELRDFVSLADSSLDRIARSESSTLIPRILRALGK